LSQKVDQFFGADPVQTDDQEDDLLDLMDKL
jgi:hypothetical protein